MLTDKLLDTNELQFSLLSNGDNSGLISFHCRVVVRLGGDNGHQKC